ncbi:MAG: twin-arginine translocase subunit TatC [Kiritimatiellae bacterium]|jgi:sec-independent protein translocase protein TatC|nr:twin-arginine translocase subunit TatC [Kiritimatiellia bacterium]
MTEEASMTILDHLEELRKAILRSFMAIFVGMMICIPFIRYILDFLFEPLRTLGLDPNEFLVVPQVMGGFKVAISIMFWSGLLLASPFVVFFIAQFVFPGLHDQEKRVIRNSSWSAVLLFFGGAAMGYYGTIHYALQNLIFRIHEWMGTTADWIFLTDYIAFVLKLIIGFGLAFQLPLVLLMVGYADLIECGTLRAYRKHVLVGLLILAMILTPPEPVSQIMMGGTLYILYEGCIVLIARHERKSVR